MADPVHELTVVFQSSEDDASRLLELLSDIVCRELGGTGEDDEHVCGGFLYSSVALAPNWT